MKSNESSVVSRQMKLLNRGLAAYKSEAYVNSPLLTAPAVQAVQDKPNLLRQYGLLAGLLDHNRPSEDGPETLDAESRLFFNTMIPSSTFICGSQGSGKSHTLSCLLENCLVPSAAAVLPNPLTALVFHYDTFISDDGGSPCEAAYLASIPGITVRVLCAPTNFATIKRTYSRLHVEVQPLQLKDGDLNTKRMLDLMAVNKEDASIPLYIHVVHRILREMRMEQQATGKSFDYAKFTANIANAGLAPTQLAPLYQRLSVLESFMSRTSTNKSKKSKGDGAREATNWTNKYMASSAESLTFSNNILSMVRLQRHLGVRIIVATQEPTISTSLLDLCSVIIIHRFTSPAWLRVVQHHVCTQDGKPSDLIESQTTLFKVIAGLNTGEALLFAPSAVRSDSCAVTTEAVSGPRYLKVRIRGRLSDDGGRSVLAK
ncbi:hypothetical protein QQS21_008702 [Conoideocrella luteorostrata]|uniref:P-loop containing nucleoside triphosphate hydrolase protein n=1 Tax=Conoideocrella luteorostrata TaxID=1105319 RepID=A0AAJ0CL32_9HYPO|nr:hypothetical protein QQS21_008702 [Conoideocrella luteorostrata]